MQGIHELIAVIKLLIKEQDEKVLNIRGGRGYGVGHPYPVKSAAPPGQSLGYVENEEEETEFEPVKISKAFKKE